MATINYNSGNINVSFFPSNVNPIWFCDKNTGGINIATNGAAIAANTLRMGNSATTTIVNGIFDANTVNSILPTDTMNIAHDQTTGVLNIGQAARNGNINLGTNCTGTISVGGTTGMTTVNSSLRVNTILATGTGGTMMIGNNTTTGNIQIGYPSTFTGNIGIGTLMGGGSIDVGSYPVGNNQIVIGDATKSTTYLRGRTLYIADGGTTLHIGNTASVSYLNGINRLGGTNGGVYVSGSEPAIENGKHMSMMTGASTKIVWYYNWSMWAENGGSMYFYYGGSPESATSGNAAARISTGGAFITISDIRKKQDIENLTYGLDAIQKLRPVSFSYKTNPNETELGFIAQEVEAIVPEIVDIDGKEGDEVVKGLKYIGFVPILVKAVQEIKLDYESKLQEMKSNYKLLEKKYDSLQSKYEALLERIVALESKNT
jgi:hypothetical protein